jgi:hypothetical protein
MNDTELIRLFGLDYLRSDGLCCPRCGNKLSPDSGGFKMLRCISCGSYSSTMKSGHLSLFKSVKKLIRLPKVLQYKSAKGESTRHIPEEQSA